MLNLCPGLDEDWFWDLIEIAPKPEAIQKLAHSRIERLLKAHRIRRLNADEILAALKVPALQLAPGAVEAASEHVLLQISLLRLLDQQRNDVASRIKFRTGGDEETGGSRGSIVTQPSSFPCREWVRRSPPRAGDASFNR